MSEYGFTLKFELPDAAHDPDAYLDRLFQAGCDDALVGVGEHGSISLDSSRADPGCSPRGLLGHPRRAECDPGGHLIEVDPDLVGPAYIAELLGCSRQNIREAVFSVQGRIPASGAHGWPRFALAPCRRAQVAGRTRTTPGRF